MSSSPEKKVHHLSLRILDVIKRPGGASIFQIREALKLGEAQEQLDRRIRDLYPFHEISRTRAGRFVIYEWIKERARGDWDFSSITKKDRAAVLKNASGTCQMCGRTISADAIKLHIDHKIPQQWGGTSKIENLWAICSTCNEGKKAFFATFDVETMKGVLSHESVHRRLLEALKLNPGNWVESDFLQFVANFDDYQEDWQKRLRDLRYLGIKIKSGKVKKGRRVIGRYLLIHLPSELPEDLTAAARRFERERARLRSRTEGEF